MLCSGPLCFSVAQIEREIMPSTERPEEGWALGGRVVLHQHSLSFCMAVLCLADSSTPHICRDLAPPRAPAPQILTSGPESPAASLTDGTLKRLYGCRLVWTRWRMPLWLKLVKSFEGCPRNEASGPRTHSCGKPGLANSSVCGTVCSFCPFFLLHWCQWSWYSKSAMLKTPYGMKFQIFGVHQLRGFGCCVTVYTHCSCVLVDENLDQNLDSTEIKGNFASLEPIFHLKLALAWNTL